MKKLSKKYLVLTVALVMSLQLLVFPQASLAASSCEGTFYQGTSNQQTLNLGTIDLGTVNLANLNIKDILAKLPVKFENVPAKPVVTKPVEPTKPAPTTPAKPIPAKPVSPKPQVENPPVTAPKEQPKNQDASMHEWELQVINLVNVERSKAGLKPLVNDVELSKVARYKSEDMRDKNYFSHESPTYGSPFDMMSKFGISYNYAGENIAAGQTSPESVVQEWMNSEGHRANILNPNFTKIGVGLAKGGSYNYYWTQEFIG